MIYRNSGKVSGQSPLSFKNYSGSIQDYLIEGNTSQNGTPSPTNPIEVQGVGERTGNLFDGSYLSYGIRAEIGTIMSLPDRFAFYIPVEPNTSYTISRIKGASTYFYYGFTDEVPEDGVLCSPFGDIGPDVLTETITNTNHKYLMFFFGVGKSENVMLNTGSTALPYEPYGYKIPITCGGTTSNIYLGEVQTTRKIKKLVLTGAEEWKQSLSDCFYLDKNGGAPLDYYSEQSITIACTHFIAVTNSTTTAYVQNGGICLYYYSGQSTARELYIRYSTAEDVTMFKQWLADQYSAGTPVTIWYVLANAETDIVNEPLHKIRNYADTISKTQSSLPISTISGQNTLTIPTTIPPSNISLTLDQKEIGKIYEGGGRVVELSGVPPFQFNAIGSQLEDYLIEGNTSQNGTPTPDDPVEVVGCGEKTENLFDESKVEQNVYYNSNGGRVNSSYHNESDYIPVKAGKTYTLYIKRKKVGFGMIVNLYDVSRVFYENVYNLSHPNGYYSFIPDIDGYIRFNEVPSCATDYMLYEGSTPLPYEPYGYKIPITCGGVTTPIYIGSEPLYGVGDDADEVNYATGKIIRRINPDTMQPYVTPVEEDPPETFPVLTTISGTNTLSVETTVQPSNITINYNKQTEIAEVYGGLSYSNLIFLKTQTMTGDAPLMYDSYPGVLTDYAIFGNSYQNGVPDPDHPVEVVSVGDLVTSGEHTGEYCIRVNSYGENLYKKENFVVGKQIDGNGNIVPYASPWYGVTSSLSCDGVERLYFSNQAGTMSRIAFYKKDGTFIKNVDYWMNRSVEVPEDAAVFACWWITTGTIGKVTGNAANTVITKAPVTTTSIYLSEPLRGMLWYNTNTRTYNYTGDELNYKTGTVIRRRIANIITGATLKGRSETSACFYVQGPSGAATNHGYKADDLLCNRLQPYSNRYVALDKDSISHGWMQVFTCTLKFSTIGATPESTSDELKTLADAFFAANPTIVEYDLGTPTTEPITLPTIPTINGQNTLSIGTTVQPSSVSITGHIKPSSIYGNLTDVNGTYIKDKDGVQIKVTG